MFGLQSEEIDRMRELLENKLNVAINRTARRLKDDLEVALAGVEGQADDTADAIENTADEILKLISPLFAAISATRDAEEAEANYQSTLIEFGTGTAESIKAAEDLLLARLKEDAALDKLSDESIPEAVAEYEKLTSEVGILTEDTQGLQDLMAGGFPSLFTPQGLLDMKNAKEDLEDILAAARGLKNLGPISPVVGRNFGERDFHQGGIVPGPPGASVPIVAQAGERIIPAAQVAQGSAGGGGGVVINIDGDLTEAVFEDLQRELILESIGRFVETR
jgi:hypothetical protein